MDKLNKKQNRVLGNDIPHHPAYGHSQCGSHQLP